MRPLGPPGDRCLVQIARRVRDVGAVADRVDGGIGPGAKTFVDEDAGADAKFGGGGQLGTGSHAARQHKQVALGDASVGAHECVEAALTMRVDPRDDRLGAGVRDDVEARTLHRRAEHCGRAAVELTRHRDGTEVGDAGRCTGLREQHPELDAEDSRAEHDDSPTRRDDVAHLVGVLDRAQNADAGGEPVVEARRRGVLQALQAVEHRDAGAGSGREDETIVGER